MDPRNAALISRAALARNDDGDNSPEVDEQLRQASRLNPLDSRVLIALGLREEFRGDSAAAERDLVRAVAVDRQYTPAWSLASFYFRADQPAKFWPVVQHVLQLDPLAVDLRPLFDLCWRETEDADQILAVLPRRESILFPYLQFLIDTQRVDAAVKLAPAALNVADPATPSDRDSLLGLVELLLQQNRTGDAVSVWNRLIDRDLMQSGKVQPEKGLSIADPEFQYPLVTRGFGWNLQSPPGTSSRIDRYARFEFDGNQPERSLLLSTVAAVLPGRSYRLQWKSDPGRLSAPDDPGLVLKAGTLTQCHPTKPAAGSCTFDVPPNVEHLPLELWYERAQGTVRIQGVFQLNELRLQPAS